MHSRHAFCRRENWRAFAREFLSRKRARLAIVSDRQRERLSRAEKWPFYKNKAPVRVRGCEARGISRDEMRVARGNSGTEIPRLGSQFIGSNRFNSSLGLFVQADTRVEKVTVKRVKRNFDSLVKDVNSMAWR